MRRSLEEAQAALAREQFAQGTLSQLEVMDAERSLHAAELAWVQASADVGMRLIAIYLATGVAGQAGAAASAG